MDEKTEKTEIQRPTEAERQFADSALKWHQTQSLLSIEAEASTIRTGVFAALAVLILIYFTLRKGAQ